MNELVLTVLMIIVTVLLFCVRYILPLAVALIGILLIQKKKNIGYLVLVIGILVEILSVFIQIRSF